MKKTMQYLRLAAFVAAGVLLAGCAKEEEPVANQEIETEDVVVTLTASVSFGESASRTLSGTGEKTFAVGDQIAVVYTNTSNATVKATSQALTVGDITNAGKSAQFTVSLTNPSSTNLSVRYVYPASMVNDSGVMTSLASQTGTLAGLQAFDYAEGSGTRTSDALPAIDLTNQLAVGVFTLKDHAGSADLSGITKVEIFSTEGDYTITPTSTISWPIYVAMKPVANKAVSFKASDATNNYWKLVSGATLAANNFYPISVTMGVPGALPGKFSVTNTIQVYFSQGNLQYQASSTTWRFANTQLNFLGAAGGNLTAEDSRVNQSGWIDFFCWGTGSTSDAYKLSVIKSSFVEWGANSILNGGSDRNWSTLPKNAWIGLLTQRSTTTFQQTSGEKSVRYAKATVNDVEGMILFPDDWDTALFDPVYPDYPTSTFASNKIASSDWARMEAFGAVFLPAAKSRYNRVYDSGSTAKYGLYWTENSEGDTYADAMFFEESHVDLIYQHQFNTFGSSPVVFYRSHGCSVRLVRIVP